jgi:hypothetical protein
MKKIISMLLIIVPVCAFCATLSGGGTTENKKQLNVNDKNIIIRNEGTRNILTKKYLDLDDAVLFQGKDSLGNDLPDPWLLPDNIADGRGIAAPCTVLLKENEKAIKGLYSEDRVSNTCQNVDAVFTDSAKNTQKLVVESFGEKGVSYAFFDGGNVAMPRGCYYDNMALALLGAGAVNIASDSNIIDLQSVKEEDKDNLIIIVPNALAQEDLQGFGFHTVVFEGNIPTPEGIEDFAASIAATVRDMAQAARDKNTEKEASRKAEELKKAVVAAVDSKNKNEAKVKL